MTSSFYFEEKRKVAMLPTSESVVQGLDTVQVETLGGSIRFEASPQATAIRSLEEFREPTETTKGGCSLVGPDEVNSG